MRLSPDAREWNQLVALSTVSDELHVVKVVCLTTEIGGSVDCWCMAPTGRPLCEGRFIIEDDVHRAVFTPCDENATQHEVFDLVFTNNMTDYIDVTDADGIVVAVRRTRAQIPAANLAEQRQSVAS